MAKAASIISANFSVAGAFDIISERFDSELENDVTRRIRKRIYSTIGGLVPPGSNLLDINCGTGIDAVALATQGYAVTGIDISSKMVEQARQKASRAQLRTVQFFQGSFERLSQVVDPPFDLVISNFGGLNCTDDLLNVGAEIARVTSPSGFCLAVVMSPFSLWETLSYAVRGKWSDSFRRMRKDTLATGFQERTFKVCYHSPSALVRAFSPWFSVKQLIGLNIFSPTPQATSFVRSYPRFAGALERLDSLVESLPLLRSVGDHYMIVLQREPA